MDWGCHSTNAHEASSACVEPVGGKSLTIEEAIPRFVLGQNIITFEQD